jgi:hypothetical protein
MASNKRQIINLVESSDTEISIKRSVQMSCSSKIIIIDHDIAINDDIDESLQRNEGEINFAEERLDKISRSINAATATRGVAARRK